MYTMAHILRNRLHCFRAFQQNHLLTARKVVNHVTMKHACRWEEDFVPNHGPCTVALVQATAIAVRRIDEVEIARVARVGTQSRFDAVEGKASVTLSNHPGFMIVLMERVHRLNVLVVLEHDVDHGAVLEGALTSVGGFPARAVIPEQRWQLLSKSLMRRGIQNPGRGASHLNLELEGHVRPLRR